VGWRWRSDVVAVTSPWVSRVRAAAQQADALLWLPLLVLTGAGASPCRALSIGLTLDVANRIDGVTYTIGLETFEGAPTAINGYTLDFEFDPDELELVDARQLVAFGALGVLPFASDCAATGRCSAGNVPGFDSSAVGPLFSVTFDVLAYDPDGVDFRAGLLDPSFDGVAQPTGEPPFELGSTEVSHALDLPPVPSLGPQGLALLVGALLLAAARRLRFTSVARRR